MRPGFLWRAMAKSALLPEIFMDDFNHHFRHFAFALRHARSFSFFRSIVLATSLLISGICHLEAQDNPGTPPNQPKEAPGKTGAKAKGKGKAKAPAPPQLLAPLAERISSVDAALHRDFPDLCLVGKGRLWTAYIEHDGKGDTLCLGRGLGAALLGATDLESKNSSAIIWELARLSSPGVIHQPATTADGAGGVWTFWGQVNERDVMTLRARHFEKEAGPEIELAASEDAGNSFVDAATDAAGRVWVVWQEIRPGASRIRLKHWSQASGWSEVIDVSGTRPGGHWEPRLALTDTSGAWVVYDSSAGSEFNLHLARVTLDGSVKDRKLVDTPDYEARAAIAADGKGGLWVAAERGSRQWGLDSRGHENALGFNAGKRFLLGHFDPAKDTFTEVLVPANGRPTPAPDPSPGFAVNVPSLAVTPDGRVWLGYRYFSNLFWRVALTAYDPATQSWLEPAALPDSTMGQDRHQELTPGKDGTLWMTWPTDQRATKAPGVARVHLARIDTRAEWPTMPKEPAKPITRSADPLPYLNESTPPRPLTEHHTWTVGGKTYRLVWGDLHRHTDISNCRTGFDGCILEAYRYAYDLAGLDFLGTSDHTDIGKVYSPYEWWHTQRQVDVFHAPGGFASLYAYEREQTFPWGHRNIVFAKRGGAIVHINRTVYRNSPWQATLPVMPGVDQIQPPELWDILKRHGQPVAIISHTGATGMGTDWTRYENGIDNTHENTVEIFQGARVSYEGLGLPQPTVGLRRDEPYTPSNRDGKNFPLPPAPITDFGAGQKAENRPALNNGVYQKALSAGHKLGVFASSDHISAHTSFGGVYVENFTREGIIAGFKARRTVAATDKIFIELSCGDRLMGEVIETKEKPVLKYRILGTAPIKRVTIVRNETNHHVIESAEKEVTGEWTDQEPLPGENRYYLRIEQSDGNMAWSSPLWVIKKE